jgi:hypothetical protein
MAWGGRKVSLERDGPAKNATGGEVFRGGSSEIAKLSWRR